MKKILFIKIISFIILTILIACNSSLKSNYETPSHAMQKDIFIIRPSLSNSIAVKKILINKIKSKIQTSLDLMGQHEQDIIRESVKQLGIQCTIFDEVYYDSLIHKTGKTYSIDKNKIKLFYASLNYNIMRLKWLGDILLQIQKNNTKQGNKLYNAIIETGREYSQKPFEEIIHEVNKEQDKLILLKSDKLKEVMDNLNIIKNLRMMWIRFIDIIIEDYRKNTDIQNDNSKLIVYIDTRYQMLKNQINSIKDIAHRIKKILKTIKYYYYVKTQIINLK
ncbi:complement regulator-acquiring protein (plasmid) [Borrelia recurrentis]|uniref:complement regulator-acquiring protein n=1 Tax=Borrelia recurrentis TaxID=44449 RepID=UPI003670F3EE